MKREIFIGSSKKIVGSKEKNSFYCIVTGADSDSEHFNHLIVEMSSKGYF